MMSLATIRALSAETGTRAKRRKETPWHPETIEDITVDNILKITNLGSYEPGGWKRTDQEWFVDSSGFGGEYEPALTPGALVRAMKAYFATHPTAGFAITEEGQFQLYITAFEYIGKTAKAAA